MKKINRRQFVKNIIQVTGGIAAGSVFTKIYGAESNMTLANGITATIPMPIQVVIDDVGWWSGKDGSARQEPYRTGIKRNHVPADYQAIVELGKGLNIRPQAAMVLCEWDKENILRKLPSATWMGENWDNSKWVGPWLEEAAEIITKNQQHFELTLHGIGHEYWNGPSFTRAEWAERDGTMRPPDQVEKHLDFFARLIKQHNLGDFPRSFVPTAFCHAFGLTNGYHVSMAELLKQRGVDYINTPFFNMYNAAATQFPVLGIDSGVLTIDRGVDLMDWYMIGLRPSGVLKNSTCGMHWPNLLHPDPTRNLEIVKGWIDFLKPYNERIETILAPNSDFYRIQLVHYLTTKIALTDRFLDIDFTGCDGLPALNVKNKLVLKITSPKELRLKSESISHVNKSILKNNGLFLFTVYIESKKGNSQERIELGAKA